MDRDEELVEDSELNVKFEWHKRRVHQLSDKPDSAATIDQLQVEETWQQVRESDGRPAVLGAGGFGQVYKEECIHDTQGTKLHRYRAVKEVKRDKNPKAFYKEELKALAKFSKQRYNSLFVQSFGWFASENHIYITMEYLPLGDLQRYLNKPFSEDETRGIISQVVRGIGYMHQYHFIHRDLKPANLLVVEKPPEKDWKVKISDFGISKRAAGGEFSTMIGTPQYAAPEVTTVTDPRSQRANYSFAADMWSIGAICVHLMTGKPPPASPDAALDCLDRRGMSQDGRAFVRKLMAKDPKLRLTAEEAAKHRWFTRGRQELLATLNSAVSSASSSRSSSPQSSHAVRADEAADEYDATALWESDGEQPANNSKLTVKSVTPARPASTPPTTGQNKPSTTTQRSGLAVGPIPYRQQVIDNRPGNLNATPRAQPTVRAPIAAPGSTGPYQKKPPAVERAPVGPLQQPHKPQTTAKPPRPQTVKSKPAPSYEGLARQQTELFRNAGPSLSKKERKQQRQEHALSEFRESQGDAPLPPWPPSSAPSSYLQQPNSAMPSYYEYEAVSPQQAEIFHNAGPPLPRNERNQYRQEQPLREFEDLLGPPMPQPVPPRPRSQPPDIVMAMGPPALQQQHQQQQQQLGPGRRQVAQTQDSRARDDSMLQAQRAREAEEIERQRLMILQAIQAGEELKQKKTKSRWKWWRRGRDEAEHKVDYLDSSDEDTDYDSSD